MMEGKKAESKCIAPPPFLQPSHHRGLLIQGLSRIRRVGGDAPHLFLRSVCCYRNIPRAESLIAIVFAIKDSHGSFMHGLDSGRTGLATRPQRVAAPVRVRRPELELQGPRPEKGRREGDTLYFIPSQSVSHFTCMECRE